MRVSIIKDDNMVVVDGYGISGIDLSSMPSNVSAVQWYETYGEVEYYTETLNGTKTKPENTSILSFSDYQFAVDAHTEAAAAINIETVWSGENKD